MRAAKIGRRAARVGFDWQEPSQVRDKVLEELREVDEALAGSAGGRADVAATQQARVAEAYIAQLNQAEGGRACAHTESQ